MSNSANKKVKELCAVIDKYEKDGKPKNKYMKLGVYVTETNDDGSEREYILLYRHINLGGFPDYSKSKNSKSVYVSVFDVSGKEPETMEFESEEEAVF